MLTLEKMHEFRKDLLPNDYYVAIDKMCKCNHPIVINHDRTIMKCSNKYCFEHMASKANNMFKSMGIKGLGPGIASKLIIANKLKHHIDILGLTLGQMPFSSSTEVRRKMFTELQSGREKSLSTILGIYQIDNISTQTANKLMIGFSSFREFFDKNDSLGKVIAYYLNAMGQSNRTYNVLRTCYHIFREQDKLIESQEKYFKVVGGSGKVTKRLLITGGVSSVYSSSYNFSPRERFVEYMNLKYDGVVNFILDSSSPQVLLTDGTTGKVKLDRAKALRIPIMTFKDYVLEIYNEYGEGNLDYNIKIR